VPKTYLAEVAGVPGRPALRRLREGVDLEDGRTAPARVRVAQATPTGAALEIVIHEGRNRQIRRMCEAVGHPVRRLVRTRIGPLVEHRLPPGEWRPLEPDEIRALYAAFQLNKSDTGDAGDV
jgi:23S rRNA pseudouridine2605 synthase